MYVAIGILLVIVGAILIWFNIPYSPVKKSFSNDIEALKKDIQFPEQVDVFEAEEFSHLPIAIQRYIEHCGYIGTPKMSYLKMEYRDVDFMQGRTGPALKIDYTQYNFVSEPSRI